MTEDIPISELRRALDVYAGTRELWRRGVVELNREAKARGHDTVVEDPDNEVELYRFARTVVEGHYAGNLPTGGTHDAFQDLAWRYIMEAKQLSMALESLDDLREEVSKED